LLAVKTLMPDKDKDPDQGRSDTRQDGPAADPPERGHAPSSALRGWIDYVDLAERVAQGVTVDELNRSRIRQSRKTRPSHD